MDVFAWNPLIRFWARPSTYVKRPNNFGDLLGPLIVRQLAFPYPVHEVHRPTTGKLLSVGSVLHFARGGDCVWGSGVNGKEVQGIRTDLHLDIRAVRGPRTARHLRTLGYQVPDVFGDPALLLPEVFPQLRRIAEQPSRIDVVVVPNLNDRNRSDPPGVLLDPTSDVGHCLRTIASARLVVGSSLHGIIVAEALGIPARAVASKKEAGFKYDDYYEGTGRRGIAIARSAAEAVAMGGAEPLDFDPRPLRDAFPIDRWAGEPHRAAQSSIGSA